MRKDKAGYINNANIPNNDSIVENPKIAGQSNVHKEKKCKTSVVLENGTVQ